MILHILLDIVSRSSSNLPYEKLLAASHKATSKNPQDFRESALEAGKLYEGFADGTVKDITDEVPFEIPESWEWVRLKNLASVLGGKRIPAGRKLTTANTGHIYIRVSDMKNGSVLTDGLLYVPDDIFPSISRYIINKEDLYITVAGTIGAVGKIPQELDGANLTENADRLVFSFIDQDWFMQCLSSGLVQNQIADATTKVGQPKLAIKRIEELLIALPPYDEQKRIVDKIRELDPEIKMYGTKEDAVASLNNEFPNKLRKSVLQQAVMGKLVPQDENDEPASVLLDRIRAEKKALIKAGKLNKDKHESIIYRRDNSHYEKLDGVERCIDDEIPYDIPLNWAWCRIKNIFNLQAGKNIQASQIHNMSTGNDYFCYGGNGIRGYVDSYNRDGDFPIIGRQGALCGNINRATGKFYATEHAVCVDTYADTNISWACLFLTALNLNQYATATAQPGLAVANINEVLIPVPPLPEQRKIVEKTASLMGNLRRF